MTTPSTPDRSRRAAAPVKKAARAATVLASKQDAQAPAKNKSRTRSGRTAAPTALAPAPSAPSTPSTPSTRSAPTAPAPAAQDAATGLAARRGHVSKVSVSLPDALTRSVRDRVGPGRFSSYVAAAVERQLELDRLAELVDGFEQRLGRPIREDLMAEAEAAWHGE